MYRGCTVAVVVPAYNEEGFVGGVIDTLPEFVDRAYVVDDASTDGTWAEIREHAAAANRAAEGTGAASGGDGEPAAAGGDGAASGGDGAPAAGGEATATGSEAPAVPREADPGGAGETATAGEAAPNGGEAVANGGEAESGGGEAVANGGAAAASGGEDVVSPGERRVVPVRHAENRGVGGAIATGYRRALADGMDVTAVMNGDGQMDPAILDRIVEPVVTGRVGYAKGERLTAPDRRASMSRWRLFGNALLTGLTRVATGYWSVADPQNGYTAISREALAAVDLDACYDGYGFCNDLLAALARADVQVADVPMTAIYGEERSGIRYSRFVPGLSALLLSAFVRRLWTSYVVRELHPLVALYGLGVAGMLAGAGTVAGAGLVGAAGAAGFVAGAGLPGTAVLAVAAGLAGAPVAFLGAGLLGLAATFDRAAADERVVRADVHGSAGDSGGGREGGEASAAAGDGDHARPPAVRTDGRGSGRARGDDGSGGRDGADDANADDDPHQPGDADADGEDGATVGDAPSRGGEVTGR